MRAAWERLRTLPRLLLVQPEQLRYDIAYGLALTPPLALGILFFARSAILLIALCFLAGIVCVLALQLARLSLPLPPWVGHKAMHPLIASLVVACFLSPRTPPWQGVVAVVVLVALDTLVWPHLYRMMLHPALLVFGILYLVERQVPVGFANPFDGRRLDDPLTLWYQFRAVIDPIKLYVGNVPGPVGATSAAALLLGLAYLWYGRKIALGPLAGFLVGIAGGSVAYGYDPAFQLSSGPALFLVGYLASDRRRVPVSERVAFAVAVVAGAIAVTLRGRGQGQAATWESLLLVGALVTLVVRVKSLATLRPFRRLAPGRGIPLRPLAVRSGSRAPDPMPVAGPIRQPALAAAPGSAGLVRQSPRSPSQRSFDAGLDSDDIVRQMRSAAARRPRLRRADNWIVRTAALLLFNPLGLVLTWSSTAVAPRTKWLVTVVSIAWYLVVAGLPLAFARGLLKV